MKDARASLAFAALGHPSRVAALRLLVRAGAAGMNVTSLRDRLDLPATTLSHHLRSLSDARLIVQEKQGRELFTIANYAEIRKLAAFLMKDCCKDAFGKEEAA